MQDYYYDYITRASPFFDNLTTRLQLYKYTRALSTTFNPLSRDILHLLLILARGFVHQLPWKQHTVTWYND